MILYVNGDSHSAGAELVHCVDGKLLIFKEDDSKYWAIAGTEEGRTAHPECIKRSYGQNLANLLDAEFICDAESASSNSRIIRTTYEYLSTNTKPDLVVIGWSTWEREEWWHAETNRYWQVNAGGVGEDWPEKFKKQYKTYIANLDYEASMANDVENIWKLHVELNKMSIDHLFFNTFSPISQLNPKLDWQGYYLEPYNFDYTYYNWCINKGFKTVSPESYHLGPDAHVAWSEFLYQTLVQKNLTS